YPSPTLTTSLLPTQLYILSSLVLPLLAAREGDLARAVRRCEDLPALVGWIARRAWRRGGSGRALLGFEGAGKGGGGGGGAGGKGAAPAPAPAREDGLALGRSTTQPPAGTRRKDVLGLEAAGEGGGGGGTATGTATGVNTPALVGRASWRADEDQGPFSGAVEGAGSLVGTPTGAAGAGGLGGLAGAGASASASAAAQGGAAGAGAGAGAQGGDGSGAGAARKSVAAARAGKGGCKVVVWRASDGFCGRGNTVSGFVEINRAALRLLPPAPAPTGTPSGVFISPDSHLHASVYAQLGEKVGIKRCIVGRGTVIGKGSKLTNCVLMENVVVGDNVKLDGCVISNGVQVRDRAQLKDCEIGRDVIVDFDTQTKGEQLVVEVD
ncbi:hypothetical protein JCM3775_001556, partial [Rhodotorula graminis]